MATQYPDIFAALASPFENHEVKLRNAPGGRQLHYITARTAMNRLDNVLGPENWWDEFVPLENSVVCKLSICLPDGHVLTKCDAGGYAGMADQGDDDKSGFSDAFKRAAAKFGVARYLYRDGVPAFVREREPTLAAAEAKLAGSAAVPPTTVPEGDRRPPQGQKPQPRGQGNGQGGGQYPAVPRSGKALFAWCKEQEQKHEIGLLKYLNSFMKLQELPSRMIDLDAEQTALVHSEAMRKLQQHFDSPSRPPADADEPSNY